MSEPLAARLHPFLTQHHVLTLAYQDATGLGACALWFAVDEALTCYFLSTLTTRHGAALAAGGTVAFTVQKDEQPWEAIQGVQGRGYCAPLPPDRHAEGWLCYTHRFPFVLRQFPAIEAALARTTLWYLRPTWLRLIDNRLGFGHKEEMELRS